MGLSHGLWLHSCGIWHVPDELHLQADLRADTVDQAIGSCSEGLFLLSRLLVLCGHRLSIKFLPLFFELIGVLFYVLYHCLLDPQFLPTTQSKNSLIFVQWGWAAVVPGETALVTARFVRHMLIQNDIGRTGALHHHRIHSLLASLRALPAFKGKFSLAFSEAICFHAFVLWPRDWNAGLFLSAHISQLFLDVLVSERLESIQGVLAFSEQILC